MQVKTVFFWIFFLLAIILGFFGYMQLKKSKKPSVDAFSLLPDSCLVYLSTADLHELNNKLNGQSLVADRLQLYPAAENIFAQLQHLDSLIGSSEIFSRELSKSQVHLALYPDRHWLLAMNIKELGRQDQLLEEAAQKLKTVKEEDHYLLKFHNASLFLQMKDGVLLLADHAALLDKALQSKQKFADSRSFRSLQSSMPAEQILNLYVNQSLFAYNSFTKSLNPALIIHQGQCSGSVNFEPSELKYNGLQAVDSSDMMQALLQQPTCGSEELMSMLPYNTSFFEAYSCGNFLQLASATGMRHGNEKFWSSCEEAALYNVETEFSENISTYLVRFETTGSEEMMAFHTEDSLRADVSLKAMSDSVIRLDSTRIYRLRQAKSSMKLFEPLLQSQILFATRLNDKLYFASNAGDLQTLIPAMRKQLSMLNNESFSSYRKNNFPDRFSYLLYTSPSANKQARAGFINLDYPGDANPLENFRHLSYSLEKEKHHFRFRFHVLHETAEKQKNFLWSTELDTTLSSTPYPFVNHNTKENEILVQDDANTLYLLNIKGNVLWKKKLSERIISPLFMVDAFRNNKYQVLFNTATAIYLVDRNGRDVENFPVKLPAPASAALSIFDYDNNKDYRLFIPCRNKCIYNYILNGKKVEGFATVKTEEVVHLPVQYAVVGTSQYLVALDREGKIYTFSRKGVGRIGLRNRATANCGEFFVDASGSLNNTYLVYVDEKTAVVNKISFADLKSIARLGVDIEINSVRYCQVDENRSMDLLLTAGNHVRAYDFSGNLITESESNSALSHADYYSDESHSIISTFSAEENYSDVFDLLHNNQLHIPATSLPLMKDLFRDNKQYLVVPNGRTLSCILIN